MELRQSSMFNTTTLVLQDLFALSRHLCAAGFGCPDTLLLQHLIILSPFWLQAGKDSYSSRFLRKFWVIGAAMELVTEIARFVILHYKAEQNPFHFDGDELHAVLKQTDGGVADVSDTEEA